MRRNSSPGIFEQSVVEGIKTGSGRFCCHSPPGPVFCLLLRVRSDYAQPITGQVTEVTCPVNVRAQPGLTPSKRQKTGPGHV